jgi:phosphatidylinositol N-acetylglucosaminyltransferase subunit P
MAEQSPAPSSSRSIYGFVIFLLFSTLFILYVLWAFVPLAFYEDYLGITELPNKYFASFLPMLVLTATTVFAFFIYPSFSFIMTPNIDSVNTISDRSSIKRCHSLTCNNKIATNIYESWTSPNVCENHQNVESRVSNYCDCKDKSKCLLFTEEGLIERLRNQESHIQNSADSDIYYVNQVLYGNK